jgi:hypothetical protein
MRPSGVPGSVLGALHRYSRMAALSTAVVSFAVACCSQVMPRPDPTTFPVAGFEFIRDEAGLLPDGDRRRAEGQLRDIAMRSGVFGVVVTATEEPADPPRVFAPIIEEVAARQGQALVALCLPDSCLFDAPAAYSDSLAEAVGRVGPAPEPAPGQSGSNVPAPNRGFELHRWVEFVGAIATLPEEP